MITKIIFVLIDCVAILDMYFTLKATDRIKEDYGKWLSQAMLAGIFAIFSNILIAFAFNPIIAKVAYAFYFASINWILLYLSAFCLSYTEHHYLLKKLSVPAIVLMILDTVSISLNLFFEHVFYIYQSTDGSGAIFYQTGFKIPYYIHLAIDYTALVIALFAIIYKIIRTQSIYRAKYTIILSVLMLVVLLNVMYMAFGLLLDSSVIFYAVAGTLIYFCIRILVPRSIMNITMGRALDDVNEGLILFDLNDDCIYANAFSRQRFNINESEYGFECEPVSSVIKSLSDKGLKYGNETYVRSAQPESPVAEEHYNIRYNELTDDNGISIGSYFLIEDTTEEFYYLQEIKDAKNAADAASRAKSTFLANMSHEIRTPLNSVLGLNEMILRSTDDPKLIEYANSIRTSGDTLLSLISDILDFSKIEANRMDVITDEYEPHQILRDCHNYFGGMAAEKGLYLNINCDENIPSKLTGDKKLIKQIMANIISNAVKYTKKGGVTVDLKTSDNENGKCDLIIDISDTGIGISSEDKELLFDAFRRVNEKENATIQGTGLGLAITKELISLMHGSISVDSIRDKGSAFHVIIPQKISDPTPAGKFDLNTKAPAGDGSGELFHAPNVNVLIVDDAKLNLMVAKELLKRTQVITDTAGGGAEAIEKCKDTRYDVILLDHRMPEPDGIETFRVISSEGINTDTPVIMLTANVVSGAESEYANMGFAGYLSKPIKSKELEEMLIRLLPDDKIELLTGND
ncbi:MAG: response regulator [Lachnospiraceae bacterium]|nr:response regulator [Lachnospiraceae bacterium]